MFGLEISFRAIALYNIKKNIKTYFIKYIKKFYATYIVIKKI